MLEKTSRTIKEAKWFLVFVASLILISAYIFKTTNYKASALVTIPTEPNLKIAFIADTGNLNPGKDFEQVLQLVKAEGAQAVMHQGDFDYNFDADGFFTKIADMDLDNDTFTRNLDGSLDLDFPYFTSVGNHDYNSWPSYCTDPDGCYSNFQRQILQNIGLTPDHDNIEEGMYSLTFKGLKLVFVGQTKASASAYASYVNDQLTGNQNIWKICSWHKNQNAMQVGAKGDEMGWDVYENCRSQGAIIATGHEHSYSRTKTLTSMGTQLVDSTCPFPGILCVDPGRTFAFVNGIGGTGVIRDQLRCLPSVYPYGCNGEWAKIYTLAQTAGQDRAGALFITFNVDGNPNIARGYLKTTLGEVIDEFTIYTNGEIPPTPTPAPTPDPNATPTPTPPPSPTPIPGPTPVILNPSFEIDINNDGKPDSWSSSANFTRSSESFQDGIFSGKFLITNNSGKTISQTVTNVTAGTLYDFSGWVNIPPISDTNFSITYQIVWKNSGGSKLGISVIRIFNAQTSGWENAVASLTAPTGATKATLQIVVKSLTGSIFVDNITLNRQ